MTFQLTPHPRSQTSAPLALPHSHAAAPANAPPVCLHEGETPEQRELLESLDDAMFAAIAGNSGALEKARALWTKAAAALPWELIDESREQYLRYAIELTRDRETSQPRTPAAAIAALEVIELLTRD